MMEKYRKILKNPIFSEEEKHHISGVTQFIENIMRLKDNEKFFENNGIYRLDIELNRMNASYSVDDRNNISVISNLKAYDKNGDRIQDLTDALYKSIGFVSSPLQKISSNYLPGKPQYRYTNYTIIINDDVSTRLKTSLITEDLLKKIDIALLETELNDELKTSTPLLPQKRKI